MKPWAIFAILGVILLSMSGSTSSVDRIANAIATAEGYFVAGSKAQRNNNPGNLTDGFGFNVMYDGMFAVFRTAEEGWTALKKQVQMMLDGTSKFYEPSMTIQEIAMSYTTTQQLEWAANVAAQLGVTVDTPIGNV